MTVTDVRVRKIPSDGKLKAVASITLDDVFVVHDIKIIEGDNGLSIAMPSRKSGENEFRDVAHPLNTETRDYIQEIILKEYREYVGIDRESVS
ncbi:MAG: septation regulator SpoVG [Lachnospiraceae bacterium]|nr:septation regulator SpoVG [Lachnospiraceae bacterium]